MLQELAKLILGHSQIGIEDINNDGIQDVLIGSDDYYLYCLNGAAASNGKPIWLYKTGGRIRGVASLNDVNGNG